VLAVVERATWHASVAASGSSIVSARLVEVIARSAP
jgi:hypothetical protein